MALHVVPILWSLSTLFFIPRLPRRGKQQIAKKKYFYTLVVSLYEKLAPNGFGWTNEPASFFITFSDVISLTGQQVNGSLWKTCGQLVLFSKIESVSAHAKVTGSIWSLSFSISSYWPRLVLSRIRICEACLALAGLFTLFMPCLYLFPAIKLGMSVSDP